MEQMQHFLILTASLECEESVEQIKKHIKLQESQHSSAQMLP